MSHIRVVFVAAMLLLASLSHAAEYTALGAFGDSLSEMGNRWIKPGMDGSKLRSTWVRQWAGPTLLNIPGLKVSGMSSYPGGTP